MSLKKTLNEVKNTLINAIEKSKNFYNKASMNAFINKILKARSFSKVNDFKSILETINKSEQKYKQKDLKSYQSDLQLSKKLKSDTTVETIQITSSSNVNQYYEQTVNKVIELNKNNKLMKVKITFPGFEEFDDIRQPTDLNTNDKSKLNSVFYWFYHYESGRLKTSEYFRGKRINNTVTVTFYSYPKIKGFDLSNQYRIIQQFEANNNTLKCVPSAIINFIETKLKSASTHIKTKLITIKNKILEEKNNKPYGIKELEELGKKLKISFIIKDLVNDDIKINENKENSFDVTFINNKLNHLEIAPQGKPEKITKEEATEILKNSDYYHKQGNRITTKTNNYIIDDQGFGDLFTDFKNENLINRNYIKSDSPESKYINGYFIGMHQFFNEEMVNEYLSKPKVNPELIKLNQQYEKLLEKLPEPIYEEIYDDESLQIIQRIKNHDERNKIFKKLNEIEKQINLIENEKDYTPDCERDYKELDLINAYYNLSNNAEYGVPSNALLYYSGDYAQQIETHIKENKSGYYNITLKTKINKLFPTLTHVMTTPQVMTLKKHNIEFIINDCLIAPQIKLKFNEKTIEKKDGIRSYCKIVGIMQQQSINKVTHIKTESPHDYIKILKSRRPNINISILDNIIEIFENKNITLKHIGLFIHSYASSAVLDFLLSNDISQIMGVKLDSIIMKQDYNPKYDSKLFKIKEAKIYKLLINNSNFIKPLFEQKIINHNCKELKLNNETIFKIFLLLSGKGGSGKTESIMRNISKSSIIYASLAWERGVDVQNKYGSDICISSMPKILQSTEDKLEIPKTCKFIVLDEITLISAKQITMIRKLYQDKIIVLIGDVDADGFYYQCSLSENLIDGFSVIDPRQYKNLQIIKYTTNYRFEEKLNKKLDYIREKMREIKQNVKITAYEQNKNIQNLVLKVFKDRIIDKSNVKINFEDMGVSANQESKKQFEYTNYFLNKGAKPKYFTNQTQIKKDIIRGQTSKIEPEHNKHEIRLFSTIHSTQGKTAEGKVIIIVEKTFDFNLWYTALSRARRLDQIFIISNWGASL